MADIINFKSQPDWEDYQLIFEENLTVYMALLNRVREEMYGKGGGNWSNVPGSCAERVIDITNSIMYAAGSQFKEKNPDYKTDDDMIFIPHRSFKENVTEALKEAIDSNCEWFHPESGLAKNFDLGDK